jgi:hypothetical protein
MGWLQRVDAREVAPAQVPQLPESASPATKNSNRGETHADEGAGRSWSREADLARRVTICDLWPRPGKFGPGHMVTARRWARSHARDRGLHRAADVGMKVTASGRAKALSAIVSLEPSFVGWPTDPKLEHLTRKGDA